MKFLTEVLAVGNNKRTDPLVWRVQVQLCLQRTARPCRVRAFVEVGCPVGPPSCSPGHDHTVETTSTAGSPGRRALGAERIYTFDIGLRVFPPPLHPCPYSLARPDPSGQRRRLSSPHFLACKIRSECTSIVREGLKWKCCARDKLLMWPHGFWSTGRI